MRYEQSAVIDLLVAKKKTVRNNHRHLCNVYGSAVDSRSAVGHWVKIVAASKTGKAELQNLPHMGCPFAAVHPEMLQCADAIIRVD